MNVSEVADPFPYHRLRMFGKILAPLDEDEIERLFGAYVLPYQRLDASQQLLIRQDGNLYLEDRRLLFASVTLGSLPHSQEPLLRLPYC